MFSNSLTMITTDRNISEFWQIVCKKCYFNTGAIFLRFADRASQYIYLSN